MSPNSDQLLAYDVVSKKLVSDLQLAAMAFFVKDLRIFGLSVVNLSVCERFTHIRSERRCKNAIPCVSLEYIAIRSIGIWGMARGMQCKKIS